ncbi:MAG: iron-containing alcohol dehydrogenase [Nanoarchaeota archaeon]
MKKDLIIPRHGIESTKLGSFLINLYDQYTGKKLKDLEHIWQKKYLQKIENDETLKNKLIKGLKIKSYIDENVIIGTKLISDISSHIKKAIIITDQDLLHLINNELKNKSEVYVTNSANGEDLEKLISYVSKIKNTVIIGFGGGRVMDYLKFVQMKTNKFTIAIPTSLATHVYASPKIHCLPAIKDLGENKTIDGPVPDLVLLDIEFLQNLQIVNPTLIRAGMGDLMACISAIPDWIIAEKHKTAKVNLVVVDMVKFIIRTLNEFNVNEPLSEYIEDYSLIQVMVCNISGWVGSAPVSGSEHLFALAAEYGFEKPPLHGELVALGTLIMTYIQKGDFMKVHKLITKLHLPLSLKKIGISIEQTIVALQNCKEIGKTKGRITVVNTIDLNRKYCEEVINDLLVQGLIAT